MRFTTLLLATAMTGCGTLSRLSEVGHAPSMTPTADPTLADSYHPISMPMPAAQPAPPASDSLWRTGSRAFFKDQRAAQRGDIVTVLVNIADAAALQDKTTATRKSNEDMGAPDLFGLESSIPHIFSKASPASLLSTSSDNANTGSGQIQRGETVTLRLAGVITQVLSNGNLVVAARQEVRVNSELRELTVTGVIRPQDIASDNTVQHDRMAEARISYGGRGQLSYVQEAPYGQQVVDALKPF